MRRPLALAMAASLILMLPTVSLGAKATRIVDHAINLSCAGSHPTSGSGVAFLDIFVSDSNGSEAFLDAWSSDTPSGPPDFSRDFDQPVAITWDGATLAGTFAVVGADGSPAGTATLSAPMTPVGDPYPIADSFRDGNHWFRATGTAQPLQPSGMLVLPTGSTFLLADCYAESSTVSVFATNPNSFVSHFAARSVQCELSNADGDTGFLFVDLSDSDSFIDAALFPADPSSPAIRAFGSGSIVGGVLDASLDTFFEDTFEPAGLPASVHLTLASTSEKFQVVMKSATSRRVTRGTLVDIEGMLTIGSSSFDLGACVGTAYRQKEIETNPLGPKPGGKVPANDLPSGAKLLAIGGKATLQTKGASPDAEASYECLRFEEAPGEFFELSAGYTVWYRFTGTGGLVTIDSSGSDYDTVMAVYTKVGAVYTPVADGCVDDVPVFPFGRTLQAAVTIPTVAGTTYYVQVGGYPEFIQYGNLKVAIR